MTTARRVLALAGLLALWGPAYLGATQSPEPDSATGPGEAVPFVAQGPLLCGGASAAMVQRYWGALGVYAEDYADLVSPEAGGIHTNDLADALSRRGLHVEVLRDQPDAALAWVRDGVPVIALLESGESRYHYVVVVAAGPGSVRVHDPIRGPNRRMARSAFLRRWAPSTYWALVAAPDRSQPTAPIGNPQDTTGAPTEAAAPDTAGARRGTGSISAPLPSTLQAALLHLRSDEPVMAAESAAAYLDSSPDSASRRGLALEMLASARYLAGDELGALAAWNRTGAPEVDLVHVHGLRHLRYRTAAEPLGIRDRQLLTPDDLGLARRRLLQLPAVRLGRVEYRPQRDGSVAVHAAILERSRWPVAPLELVGTGLGALVNQRAEVGIGPILPVGERWRVEGAWQEARSLAAVAVDVPWTPLAAVASLRAGWTEERFAGSGGATLEYDRVVGTAGVERWMDADTRLGVTLGLERWNDESRMGRVGASALQTAAGDRVLLGATVDGWAGRGDRFARGRLAARVLHTTSGREWSATVGGTLVSRGAPPTLWDGAGVGRVRAPLLRGHLLVRDGRIGADAFGRGLLYGTLAHSWFIQEGPARAGLTLFVDGARVWRPLTGDGPRSYLDPGLELNLSTDERTVAVSAARGGNGWVLSARVGATALPWLQTR